MPRTILTCLAGAALCAGAVTAGAYHDGGGYVPPHAAGFGDSFTRGDAVGATLRTQVAVSARPADATAVTAALPPPLPLAVEDDRETGHFFDCYFDQHFRVNPDADGAMPFLDDD